MDVIRTLIFSYAGLLVLCAYLVYRVEKWRSY